MCTEPFPVIDLIATGNNIKRLRLERGLTVRDLQDFFGFEEPRAIYKWQSGQCLPTVDNLYALGHILKVTIDEILISSSPKLHSIVEQQASACCSHLLFRSRSVSIKLFKKTTQKNARSMNCSIRPGAVS